MGDDESGTGAGTTTAADDEIDLDEIDEGVLFALQRDARNVTTEEIADEVNVSPSTVRNRIEKLEQGGVIEGYEPKINYERGGFPLHVLFVCTAAPKERSNIAEDVLHVKGVTGATEMLTSEHNLYVEVIAASTSDLSRITDAIDDLGLVIHSSEIVTKQISQPWGHFEFETE